jgi:hypothetical protein
MDWDRDPITWPPRSSNLTPLDFFLWGYIKDLVHQKKVQSVEELRYRITAACKTVTPVMLQNTWREVKYRVDMCRATNGTRVEIYWGKSKLADILHVSFKFPRFYLHYFRKYIILLLVEILPDTLLLSSRYLFSFPRRTTRPDLS